jgi:hypothetical protein
VNDLEPAPIPDWVLDWVELRSQQKARKSGAGMPKLADDFDFDDFCEHYREILGDVDEVGGYHIPDICPGTYEGEGTGHRHENSTRSGFHYDGEHLGWHCFAQGCQASEWGIGELLAHMNQYVGRYPNDIWEVPEDDPNLVDVLTDVVTEIETEEAEKEPEDEEEEVFTQPPAQKPLTALVDAPITVAVESSQKAAVIAALTTKPIAVPTTEHLKFPSLRFPYEALPEGRFKALVDKVSEGGLPHGLACPAVLTAASVIPIYDIMDGAR